MIDNDGNKGLGTFIKRTLLNFSSPRKSRNHKFMSQNQSTAKINQHKLQKKKNRERLPLSRWYRAHKTSDKLLLCILELLLLRNAFVWATKKKKKKAVGLLTVYQL